MTTCFGHRMTIIRSTRAIMYMFLLCNDILLWNVIGSHSIVIVDSSDSNTTVWKEPKNQTH